MSKPVPEMIARQSAVRQTMLRFGARPFRYGSGDCIVMARFHLRKAKLTLPALPPYKSLKGAVTALRRRDCATVEALIATLGLWEIPPAMMRLGDIATMRGTDSLSSVVIAEGQMVFGYHEDDLSGAKMIVPFEFTGAWRVPFGGAG